MMASPDAVSRRTRPVPIRLTTCRMFSGGSRLNAVDSASAAAAVGMMVVTLRYRWADVPVRGSSHRARTRVPLILPIRTVKLAPVGA